MTTLESISHFVSARFLILCCDVTKAEATCLAVLTRQPTLVGKTLCCDVTKAAGQPGLLKFEMQDSEKITFVIVLILLIAIGVYLLFRKK